MSGSGEFENNSLKERILGLIISIPGLHFKGIQRALGVPNGTLQYHLERLEDEGLVKRHHILGYTRFYPSEIIPDDAKVIGILRQPNIKKILRFLVMNQEATFNELVKVLNLSPSTVAWYLKRLEAMRIISKERLEDGHVRYFLTEHEKVKNLLDVLESGIMSRLTSRWIGMWDFKI